MIRFFDAKVYNITELEVSRDEMLAFFLCEKGRLTDVIAVYEPTGNFLGIITYKSLLSGERVDDCINRATIHITENFWEEARFFFDMNQEVYLTVLDEKNDILGFIYEDGADSSFWKYLDNIVTSMEQCGIPALNTSKYHNIKMIVITDLNELAWRLYKIFLKCGYQVCVIGEKWEWFGCKSGVGYLDCAEFEKLYLYAEGTDFLREAEPFAVARYKRQGNSFEGIVRLGDESSRIVYQNAIRKLEQKGVAVCECLIPEKKALKYKTELEERDIDGESLLLFINNQKSVSDETRAHIVEVYGKTVIEELRKQKTSSLLHNEKKVFVGRMTGVTLDNEPGWKRRVYVLGFCIVGGMGCLAKESLVGMLQKIVYAKNYQVIGLGLSVGDYINWQMSLEKIPIRQGDIVIVVSESNWFSATEIGCKRIDLSYVYDDQKRNTMFFDTPIHSNAEGNRALAKAIYEGYLKNEMERWEDCTRNYLQKGEMLDDEMIEKIFRYTDKIKYTRDGATGAIVMNCNPFTYGHRYLIEYAAKKADVLYIFIVEEDRSFFKFEDRIQMVKDGTNDLNNVVVVPSGRWVLSYKTLPIYFEKAEKQEAQVDASMDLEIFARYIAPMLHITKRFVGEEPSDKVTRQYNEQMQVILGEFGIELEIIPRKEQEGTAISASSVRRYMREENWEAVKKLVPQTTYEKLVQYLR